MRTVPRMLVAVLAVGLLVPGSPVTAAEVETSGQKPVRLKPNIVDLEPNVVDLRPQRKGSTYTVDSDVLFAFDSAKLGPDATGVLDEVVQGLKDADAKEVTVVGHTDAVGSDSYNQKLSKRRAGSVRGYLQQQVGDPAVRYTSVGKGETDPIASNDTGEGRRKNRRVTVSYTR